jgi:hypothetical protein
MANIKDVALHAGVSVTTVSHVVNGTRFVSEVARQRVEAAVRELGYVPSAVARSLKHNTTRTFGMVIPNNSNPYFAEIIQGVEARCFAAGYNVILCNSNDDPERQAAYLRVLAEKRIDGLIFVVTGSDAVVRATLGGINTPLVLLDREVSGVSSDLVEVNHVLGSQMATPSICSNSAIRASPASAAHRDSRPVRNGAPAGRTRWRSRRRTQGKRSRARRFHRARRLSRHADAAQAPPTPDRRLRLQRPDGLRRADRRPRGRHRRAPTTLDRRLRRHRARRFLRAAADHRRPTEAGDRDAGGRTPARTCKRKPQRIPARNPRPEIKVRGTTAAYQPTKENS